MPALRARLSPAAAAALAALACLLFVLVSRRESAAQAERPPRWQLTAAPKGDKSFRVFLLDASSGDVWHYEDGTGPVAFRKLLDGPR